MIVEQKKITPYYFSFLMKLNMYVILYADHFFNLLKSFKTEIRTSRIVFQFGVVRLNLNS